MAEKEAKRINAFTTVRLVIHAETAGIIKRNKTRSKKASGIKLKTKKKDKEDTGNR